MAYRLAIFDFDDTVLHLDVDWPSVRKELLSLAAKRGIETEPDLHLAIMANDLSKSGVKKETDGIFLKYESLCASKKAFRVFPEMLSFIEELHGEGIKLAIASGNHTLSIKSVLEQIGMLDCFDLVCGRDLVERNKPDPDQLLFIAQKLNVHPDEALFAGDSRNDEAAAKAAGIRYLKIVPSDLERGVRELRSLLL